MLIKNIHRLNEFAGRSVSWLNTVLVLLVCGDVISRYFFNDTAAWVMELEWHLFALVFLLGAGYALRHGRHVRVDLFYSRFSPQDQALVNALGGIIFLIPWCILLIWMSTQYAWGSYLIREGSPDPGGLPARYIIKFAIPLAFFLLLLQGIVSVVDSLKIYREGHPTREEESDSIPEGL